MKLHELKSLKPRLTEDEIELKQADDLWTENKDDAKTYITDTVYDVRKLQGGVKYEVTIEDGTERKPFAMLTKADLDKSFTQIHPNSAPDVEGYIQYRSVDEVEAFKYTDDTVKVDVGGAAALINKGDYLIRTVDGNDFTYEVKKAKDFESTYTEK